jgi:hypothetical protein
VKKPLRDPKIDREWRTTFILASVAALLSLAVVVVAAMRNFWIRRARHEAEEPSNKGQSGKEIS